MSTATIYVEVRDREIVIRLPCEYLALTSPYNPRIPYVFRGEKADGEYVIRLKTVRARRFFSSVISSVERGDIVVPVPLGRTLQIPAEVTEAGARPLDEFYSRLLFTVFFIEHADRIFELKPGEHVVILRRVSRRVVRGVVHPPKHVKALVFVKGGEEVYSGWVGYDKRLKFTSRFIRDLVPGITFLRAREATIKGDDYLVVDLDNPNSVVQVVEFEEPVKYINVEELEEEEGLF